MSDKSSTTDEATPATGEAKEPAQGDPAPEPLGENGKLTVKKERDRANELEKQLRAATAKLTELERANETAIEKATREAAEAKAAVDEIPQKVADQLRDYLRGIHDISEEDAGLYLTASDPETLLRQAAGLSKRTPTAPRADLSQGGTGSDLPLNGDPLLNDIKQKLGIR